MRRDGGEGGREAAAKPEPARPRLASARPPSRPAQSERSNELLWRRGEEGAPQAEAGAPQRPPRAAEPLLGERGKRDAPKAALPKCVSPPPTPLVWSRIVGAEKKAEGARLQKEALGETAFSPFTPPAEI